MAMLWPSSFGFDLSLPQLQVSQKKVNPEFDFRLGNLPA